MFPVPKKQKKKSKSKSKKASVSQKKTTKSIKKDLIDELDELWQRLIFIIYAGKCALCGKIGSAGHHFHGKKAHSPVRWNPDNGIYLCVYCHIIKNHKEGDTEHTRQKLIERIGEENFERLNLEAHSTEKIVKWNIDRLEEIKTFLKSEISRHLEIINE